MTVIAQQFSPQSLRITIQIPIGRWNGFKELVQSLSRPISRCKRSGSTRAALPVTHYTSFRDRVEKTQLMRYTGNVLANEGWRGSLQLFLVCKVNKSTRTTKEEVQTCDWILFSLCRVADCHFQMNVYRDNC